MPSALIGTNLVPSAQMRAARSSATRPQIAFCGLYNMQYIETGCGELMLAAVARAGLTRGDTGKIQSSLASNGTQEDLDAATGTIFGSLPGG